MSKEIDPNNREDDQNNDGNTYEWWAITNASAEDGSGSGSWCVGADMDAEANKPNRKSNPVDDDYLDDESWLGQSGYGWGDE